MDAYRAEVSCVNRLRHEIARLDTVVQSQREELTTLTDCYDRLRKDKRALGLCINILLILSDLVSNVCAIILTRTR